MFYSEEIVEEVRTKNDIVDMISGYVKLQKKGSSYFGLCALPIYAEKNRAFYISLGSFSRSSYSCRSASVASRTAYLPQSGHCSGCLARLKRKWQLSQA